jgi:hypothetical protein
MLPVDAFAFNRYLGVKLSTSILWLWVIMIEMVGEYKHFLVPFFMQYNYKLKMMVSLFF